MSNMADIYRMFPESIVVAGETYTLGSSKNAVDPKSYLVERMSRLMMFIGRTHNEIKEEMGHLCEILKHINSELRTFINNLKTGDVKSNAPLRQRAMRLINGLDLSIVAITSNGYNPTQSRAVPNAASTQKHMFDLAFILVMEACNQSAAYHQAALNLQGDSKAPRGKSRVSPDQKPRKQNPLSQYLGPARFLLSDVHTNVPRERLDEFLYYLAMHALGTANGTSYNTFVGQTEYDELSFRFLNWTKNIDTSKFVDMPAYSATNKESCLQLINEMNHMSDPVLRKRAHTNWINTSSAIQGERTNADLDDVSTKRTFGDSKIAPINEVPNGYQIPLSFNSDGKYNFSNVLYVNAIYEAIVFLAENDFHDEFNSRSYVCSITLSLMRVIMSAYQELEVHEEYYRNEMYVQQAFQDENTPQKPRDVKRETNMIYATALTEFFKNTLVSKFEDVMLRLTQFATLASGTRRDGGGNNGSFTGVANQFFNADTMANLIPENMRGKDISELINSLTGGSSSGSGSSDPFSALTRILNNVVGGGSAATSGTS